MNQIRLEAVRRTLLESFWHFFKFFWSVIDAEEFEERPFLKIVATQLQALFEGRIKKLMINIIPRAGKSKMTAAFQAWCFAKNPNYKIISATHTGDLAKKLALDVRKILNHPDFLLLFPQTQVFNKKLAVDTKVEFSVGEHGYYKGFSILGSVQGQGCDLLFSDDLIGNMEKLTPEHCEQVYRSYKENFRSRANKQLKEVLIQTRYHPQDPAGQFLQEEADKWIHLNFPMFALAKANEFEYRQPGEPLIGTIQEALEKQQNTTPRAWAALYQQSPLIEGGNLFREEWIQYYLPTELPSADKQAIDFYVVDPSMGTHDYCSIGHFRYQTQTKLLYLVDLLHQRWPWPEIIKQLKKIQHKKCRIMIEVDGQQKGLLDFAKQAGISAYGVRTHGRNKVARAEQVSYFFANGRFLIPKQHLLSTLITEELLSFPNHRYDDIVDVCIYAIDCIEKRTFLPYQAPKYYSEELENSTLDRFDHIFRK